MATATISFTATGTGTATSTSTDDYFVPADPMDELQCDSCQ
ncbi:MAG: hypothetical protein ACOH1K_02950 [Rhodoglobus sp.]